MKLEQLAKKNEEKFAKLEQKQNNTINKLENNINISDLVIKSLENNTPTSDITNDTLSSNIYQKSKIQYSILSIHTESKLLEDKEIKFMDRIYKKQISNEIRERNWRKKLRSQDLFSDNNSSNSSYNKISYNQKVKQGLRLKLFICTKDNNHKINKVFDIQIPEFLLEAILTESNKVTLQNIVDLFK
ncbi:5692_t:CDS:2, partial [Gigaspora margarita]